MSLLLSNYCKYYWITSHKIVSRAFPACHHKQIDWHHDNVLRPPGCAAGRRFGPLCRAGGAVEGWEVGHGVWRPVGPAGCQRGVRPARLWLRPQRDGTGRLLPSRQGTGPAGRAELYGPGGEPVGLSGCTERVRLRTQGGCWCRLFRSTNIFIHTKKWVDIRDALYLNITSSLTGSSLV